MALKWAQLLERSPQVTRINCCFPFCVLSRPILFPWRQILPFRQCHRCLRDGHKVSSGVCAKPPKTCNQQAAVCVLLETFVWFTCFIFSRFWVAFIYIMKNKLTMRLYVTCAWANCICTKVLKKKRQEVRTTSKPWIVWGRRWEFEDGAKRRWLLIS